MRVTLIHNPSAGEGDAQAESLAGLLEAEGHTVASAVDDSTELVAVAGGDGTISRVAKELAGRGIPIAPLPSGTANNISRTLGLVGRPFEQLVRDWPAARRVKLDVGVAAGPWGERHFVEGFGLGVFADVLARPSGAVPEFANRDAKVAYGLERLRKQVENCRPIAIEAQLDGTDVSGDYLLLEAVSILYVGPSLFLAPDSQPGDGQFDLVTVTEAERERLRQYLATWQENKERLAVLPSRKGKRLSLAWHGFPVHIDDELWPDGEAPAAPGRIDICIEGHGVEFLAATARRK